MTNVTLQSPLVGKARLGKRELVVDARTCLIDEIPFVEMLNLRGNARDAGFVAIVRQVTGLALPLQANTASVNAQRQLLWLGPDEWLLKTRDAQGAAMDTALRSALQGQHFATVDVGHGNTTLVVEGAAAADLLARGCPLDLHPRTCPSGTLAQTHIAKANVVLLCTDAARRFEITVRRSFASYLFDWLCEAGS